MKSAWLALALVAFAGRAHADESTRYLPADAFVVGKTRPLAVLGVLRRAGKRWPALVRDAAHLPQPVDPLDPSVIATTGIDPAVDSWASVSSGKNQTMVRLVLALTGPEAVPIATGMLAMAFGKLDTSVSGMASATTAALTLIVRPLGRALIIDVALPDDGAKPTSAKALARIIPLQPPRSFVARGTARRFDASDAIAMWIDLPSMERWELRTDHAKPRCAVALRAPGTFDDLFVTAQLRGPNAARVEVALGAAPKKLAAFTPPTPVRPMRSLVADGDAVVSFALGDTGPIKMVLQAMAAPAYAKVKATHELDAETCTNGGDVLVMLRRWPEMIAAELASGPKPTEAHALRTLAGVRSGAIWSTQKAGEDPLGPGGVALFEIDDAARGDLDRLLESGFTPTTPLRIAGQQVTTYAAPPDLTWLGPDPVLFFEPLAEGGTIVGLGARDRARAAYERAVRPADGNVPSRLAHLTVSPQLVAAAAANTRVSGIEVAPLVDGVRQVEVELVRDAEAVRMSADLALAPQP